MAVGYKSKLNGAFSQPVDLDDVYVRKEYFDTGNLWGWGRNSESQLGDNTAIGKSSPVQTIAGGTNWKQVSCGGVHTMAIKADGTLWGWGAGTFGSLGTDSSIGVSSPVQTVTGGTNWKEVSCGDSYNTAAIKTDGTLWLWGRNDSGQLGDNSSANKSSPVQTITGASNWKQVSCGGNHTGAVKTDGTLWTWGSNSYGQLGDNTTTTRSSPVQTIAGGNNWKQVSCGNQYTAAIKTDGTLWLWGTNDQSHLGDGTSTARSSPVQTIAGGNNWKQVSCGGNHTGAVKTDGTLWTWGRNSYGQLGDNTTTTRSSPVQTVTSGTNWKQVSLTYDNNTSAIKTDGTLWTWGSNSYGQLGDATSGVGTRKSSPVQTVAGGSTWKQVSGGSYAFMALKG